MYARARERQAARETGVQNAFDSDNGSVFFFWLAMRRIVKAKVFVFDVVAVVVVVDHDDFIR